jgi:hypothetical protein
MRGPFRKKFSKRLEVNGIPLLKGCLTDQMLLGMMMDAQAERPPIGRLNSDTAISAQADMCAFHVGRYAARH